VVLDHLALWGLKERLESKETEDLKGHGVQKVHLGSQGAMVTQGSQDLLESQGLRVNLDNEAPRGSRVSKASPDLQAYLECLA